MTEHFGIGNIFLQESQNPSNESDKTLRIRESNTLYECFCIESNQVTQFKCNLTNFLKCLLTNEYLTKYCGRIPK